MTRTVHSGVLHEIVDSNRECIFEFGFHLFFCTHCAAEQHPRRCGAPRLLALENRDGLLEDSIGVRAGYLGRLHLDAHLVVLGVGLGAFVLGVGTSALAAAMIKDGDHRRLAGLVHGHADAAGAGAKARLEGGAWGECRGGCDDGSESNDLGGHL